LFSLSSACHQLKNDVNFAAVDNPNQNTALTLNDTSALHQAATKASATAKGSKPANPKASWKPEDNKLLVETLLKERDEGHQPDTGFKSVLYTTCAEALVGSEIWSGGAVKSAENCYNRWGVVRVLTILIQAIFNNFCDLKAQERF
jgi:hypothetical protein